jgi:hypothetical protein
MEWPHGSEGSETRNQPRESQSARYPLEFEQEGKDTDA